MEKKIKHEIDLYGCKTEVDIVTKAYYCSPAFKGDIPSYREIKRSLILIGNTLTEDTVHTFCLRWGLRGNSQRIYSDKLSPLSLAIRCAYINEISNTAFTNRNQWARRTTHKVVLLEYILYGGYESLCLGLRSLAALTEEGPYIEEELIREYLPQEEGYIESSGLLLRVSEDRWSWGDPSFRTTLRGIEWAHIYWMLLDRKLSSISIPIGDSVMSQVSLVLPRVGGGSIYD